MATTVRDQHHDLQYELEIYADMVGALDEEITAVRAQEQREATPLCDGRRADGDTGGGVRYVFRARTPFPARVGERVRCAVDGVPSLRAVVAAVTGDRLTLDLETDLGPVVPAAAVHRDAAWLQEALRRRVATAASALARGEPTAPYDHERALAALYPDAAPAAAFVPLAVTDSARIADGSVALNGDQTEAVRRILAQPTTILWGPPGTGKTVTLAKAVAELAHQGQRVLVVTPSNTAADVLLAQLYPWMAEHPLIGRGVVQRRGAHVTRQLSPVLRDLFVPADILRRLREESDEVRAFFEEERASVAAVAGAATIGVESELASLAAERAALAAEVAQNCRVVVTPIANIYLLPELWRQYDAVVIDEASMIGIPAVVLAAGLSRARLVVAGDWQQLGPVTVADTPAVRRWLGQDVFHAAGIPALVATEGERSHVVMLRDQYRMPPAVCALVADEWYLGRLRTAHRRAPALRLPFGAGPVVLVDTSALEPTVRRGGRANTTHATVVASLVSAIRASAGGAAARVGVYTLYREQVQCLRAAQGGLSRSGADVTGTVHRAQGAEVDVAVVDLCDGPGAAPTFLRARTCQDSGARLLNVSATRPRDALVVVAHVPFLERAGGPVIRRFLARLRESGALICATEFAAAATSPPSPCVASCGRSKR